MTHGQKIALIEGDFFDPSPNSIRIGRTILRKREPAHQDRNRQRSDRDFGAHVIRQQRSQLRRSLRTLRREGFSHVFVLESAEEVEATTIERAPLWNDKKDEHGPFDIIGDVHGCCDELERLLGQLGYPKLRSSVRK